MKAISDFADHQESPIIDGIIFPDGTIQLFDFELKRQRPYAINIGTKTSIDKLEQEGELHWSSCCIMTTLNYFEYSIKVIAGEATSWGEDGFVAVIDSQTGKLIWLAFFTCSNPFNFIEIIGEEVHVRSTLECVWKFKLKNPVDFSVTCSEFNY